MRTKAEATAAAKALLKRMKSPGWKIDVWENIGWHYRLKRGTLSLWEHGEKSYGVYYSDEVGGVGEPAYYGICGHRSTEPNRAVEYALRQMQAIIAGELALLNLNRREHGLKELELA